MKKEDARKRIEKLRQTIDYHRYAYHVLDQQEISDGALDSLKHELYLLEQQYPDLITSTSPTQRVGGTPLEKFEKVTHRYPMLSMEDVFSSEEFKTWEQRMVKLSGKKNVIYYAEPKMDGLAVSLIYKDSFFLLGATRGDAKIGEQVTQNLKTIEAIPLQLHIPSQKEVSVFLKKFGATLECTKLLERIENLEGIIEIRGEVFMTKKVFASLNKHQQEKGEALFANPRNAAAGSIRQLDSKLTAKRKLDFFGYALMEEEAFGLKTHEQAHELMKLLGIKTNPLNEVCNDGQAVEVYRDELSKKRENLNYWTDGVVVVINDNALYYSLGVVGKTPRGLVAYKFPAEQVTTVLKDVHFQIGRTGVLTPVATFEPVSVAGTTVTHATLHNIDEIQRLGVKIGDTVIIEKAGDIIPKVLNVVKEMRNGKEKDITVPKNCPLCGSAVVRRDNEVALYCSNKTCFGKERESLIHFVSKKGFDIDGLGEKIIEQLIQEGLVRTPADLFELRQGDLEPLERFAEKSASNLYTAIQAKKTIEFPRFIYALGIRHVGEETAYDLAKKFLTLDTLMRAERHNFEHIQNIGPVVAQSLADYFSDKNHKELLRQFHRVGVTVHPMAKLTANKLEGLSFVITGTLETLGRQQAEQLVRDNGGSPSSSVSKETDYVVVGKDPGSKYEKAKKLGIKILNEQEFLDLVKRP